MIKVSNKKLAVKYPSVTMYPHHAHLFAVMEGIGVSDKDMLAWLAVNYIMVQKGPDNLDFSTGYEILTSIENCPMLECLCVSLIIAKKRYAAYDRRLQRTLQMMQDIAECYKKSIYGSPIKECIL